MVEKVSDHINPVEIEDQARNTKIAGMSQEIPEVPLELDDS